GPAEAEPSEGAGSLRWGELHDLRRDLAFGGAVGDRVTLLMTREGLAERTVGRQRRGVVLIGLGGDTDHDHVLDTAVVEAERDLGTGGETTFGLGRDLPVQ